MSAPKLGLRNGPSKPATLYNRFEGILQSVLILFALYSSGLPHAIWVQITQPNPIHLFNPIRWRNLIVEAGLPVLLTQGDIDSGHLKKLAVTEFANGKVLELGAGTGLNIKYYDQDKVEEVYLVEPFAKLHKTLKVNINKSGKNFASKLHIIPYGVEEREKLKVYGIEEGTFDTIVLVQVLCSIPNREDHLPYLQSLLKPGGQILIFEHVASEDRLTELLQKIYNPLWTRLSMGCNVDRHSGNMVKDLGGWEQVQMRVPEAQHGGLMYPRVIGRYVKAK